MLSPISLLITALALAACMDRETTQKALESLGGSGPRPDVMPAMLNETLPFRYPPALFAQKVQGNVTLRIFIDSTGTVLSDSTSVEDEGTEVLRIGRIDPEPWTPADCIKGSVSGTGEAKYSPPITSTAPISTIATTPSTPASDRPRKPTT